MNDMVLPPRHGLSLCAGGGGLDMGLGLAEPGFATSCYVEIEEYPRSTLIAGQRAGYLHTAPIWDDLKRFNAVPWRGQIDTLLAGYPCFVAGTIICTKRGHIPIEEVAVGDLVLTHAGRWRPVTATMSKRGAPVRRIKAQGVPGVVCTDEHPFYLEGGEWRNAEDLRRGDRVGQVLPDVDDDSRSPEFWWVIGRYLADGWRQWSPSRRHKRGGRISICCARQEADELERRIREAGLSPYRSEERTTTRFAITKHDLYEFCEQFGSGAAGKHLPGWVLGLDETRARSLCEGYFSGDGYRYDQPKGGTGWRVTTVSKALALSFGALAQRAYGVVASVRRQEVGSTTEIEGRTVRQRTQYILIVPDRNRSGRIDGRYGWKRVRENEICGTADVFNIAVDGDESYVADGAIVHNCQPFSQAGQRKGENDPRHLWTDIERIIEELGDGLRWCLFENVAGHLTLGLETVVRALQGMGFRVAVGLFSAEETGATHERQRVFIVAHRPRVGAGEQDDTARPEPRKRAREAACGRGLRDDAELAHADGRNNGAERQQRGGQQRLHPEGGGTGFCDVGNASRIGRGEGRAEHEIRSRRDTAAGAGGEMADTGEPGPQGREWSGAPDQRDRPAAPGSASEFRRPLLHPPGPADMDHWRAVLDMAPDLAPAVALGDIASVAGVAAQMVAAGHMAEAEAESIVRGMANGMAARTRALRLLGNGVHPLAAAYAWRALSYAHGLGRVDLGACEYGDGARADGDVLT